jgi:hypothetical protein
MYSAGITCTNTPTPPAYQPLFPLRPETVKLLQSIAAAAVDRLKPLPRQRRLLLLLLLAVKGRKPRPRRPQKLLLLLLLLVVVV